MTADPPEVTLSSNEPVVKRAKTEGEFGGGSVGLSNGGNLSLSNNGLDYPTSSGPASPGASTLLSRSPGDSMLDMSIIDGSNEEVSTLFVIGFPDDFTEREFQNMFTFAAGYESAALKRQDRKQLIGFVKFETRQQAEDARDFLIGRKVDIESGSTLKAEIAKKNLHTKRGLSNDQNQKQRRRSNVHQFPPPYRRDSLPNLTQADWRYSPDSLPSAYDTGFDAYQMPNAALERYAQQQQFSDQQHTSATMEQYLPQDRLLPASQLLSMRRNSATTAAEYMQSLDYAASLHQQQQQQQQQQQPRSRLPFVPTSIPPSAEEGYDRADEHLLGSSGFMGAVAAPLVDRHPFSTNSGIVPLGSNPTLSTSRESIGPPSAENPPCNTLYVGNLPPGASEEELRRIFVNCLGFRRLSFQSKPSGPMCFVEFDDIPFATQAMMDLHGSILSTSTRGGIRLSYAKNSLGMRSTDHNGRRSST